MSRRRSDDPNGDSKSSSNKQDIPFRDADPSTGELPLDELDTFIVPARDEKGITQSVSFRIPPYMERAIEIVLRSGRFPYLNLGSFFRHAGVRHVRFLTEIRASIPQHLLPSIETILEICRDNEMRIRVEEAFETITRQITSHRQRGDMMEALRLMSVVKNRIEKVHPSSWQRRFYTDFQRMHADLFNSDGTIRTLADLRREHIITSLDL